MIKAPVYEPIINKSFESGTFSGCIAEAKNSVEIIRIGNNTGNDKIGRRVDLLFAFEIRADNNVVPLPIAIPVKNKFAKKSQKL